MADSHGMIGTIVVTGPPASVHRLDAGLQDRRQPAACRPAERLLGRRQDRQQRQGQEMKSPRKMTFAATIFCAVYVIPAASYAADKHEDHMRGMVDNAIRAVMVKDNIPGMAVGIAIAEKSQVFNYGLASREPRKPVTDDTLFEIGSVSKTFTATLASWAEINNQLSLSEKVGKYLPSLQHSQLGDGSLL